MRLAGTHSFLYLTLKLARHSMDASDLQTLLFSVKRGSTELASRLLQVEHLFQHGVICWYSSILLSISRLLLICPALLVRTPGTVCSKISGPKRSSEYVQSATH